MLPSHKTAPMSVFLTPDEFERTCQAADRVGMSPQELASLAVQRMSNLVLDLNLERPKFRRKMSEL